VLSYFNCENEEEITTVQMIPSSDGDTAICIGTVFHKFGEREPSRGRLVLFNAKLDTRLSSNKLQLKQISELEVKGCVHALARVDGLLAAAIGPSVSILSPFPVFCGVQNCNRFPSTKSTARVSERSQTGITTTWLRVSSPGNLGCLSETRYAQCRS